MRLYELVLKRLLSEAGQPDLGNVQFSPIRTDGVSTDEPNTESEERIYRAFRDWLSGGTIDPDITNELRLLMKSKKYSSFFREPPSGAEVYRGTKMTEEALSKLLNKPVDKNLESDDHDVNVIVTPRVSKGGVASWSHDMSVAEDFAWGTGKATKRGNYGVVLIAQTDNNPGVFLDFNHIVNITNGFPKLAKREQEVLAMGPVKVSQIVWTRLKTSQSYEDIY